MTDILQFQWSEPVPLEIRIRVSPRARYLRLRVMPQGRVEVVVPPKYDRRRIPDFVEQHRNWLERNVRRLRRECPEAGPLVRPERIELPAVDGYWEVEYRNPESGRPGCRERADGGLLVVGGDGEWRDSLQRWLARVGREHLVPWLEQVSRETGLEFNGTTIRGQKTRWGSCSSRKTINLNYRLLFLPPPLVRYLFVHELCHTIHMNHSKRYWALVAKKEPDYRRLDGELRRAASFVPVWARAD